MTLRQKSVTVTVPGSTANLGPGFDCFGMALDLFLRLKCTIGVSKFRMEFSGEGGEGIPLTKENLIYRAFRAYFRRVRERVPVVAMAVKNEIPLNRGLGSSGAAIVAGLLAARGLAHAKLSNEALHLLASRIEGHPDNVGASLYKGFTITCAAREKLIVQKIAPPACLELLVIVPEVLIQTRRARGILPTKVPLADAVANVQRAASVVQFLHKPCWEHLNVFLEDRLHQPYRSKLIPEYRVVLKLAKAHHAKGLCISGSGPTMLIFAPSQKTVLGERICAYLRKKGVASSYMILHPVP